MPRIVYTVSEVKFDSIVYFNSHILRGHRLPLQFITDCNSERIIEIGLSLPYLS